MKKETTQTPGPWHIGLRQPNSDKFIYGPSGEEVANCDRLTNFPDVNLANARLIAAAPEMLEALKRILDYTDALDAHFTRKGMGFDELGRDAPTVSVAGQARAAIAKAEGKKG